MARALRVVVEGDSKDGRKALGAFADALDDASRQTDALGDDMRSTTREASRLERQIGATRDSIKKLNAEYERGGDAKVLRQLEQQQRELLRIERIKKRINDDDDAASRAADKARKAAARESDRARRVQVSSPGLPSGALGAILPSSPLGLGGTALLGQVAIGASPFLGGLLTGGVGAAAGLGAVGAGIGGAIAGDPQVFLSAWLRVIEQLSKRWQSASAGFGGPLLGAIEKIAAALNTIDMERIFGEASKFVDPLAEAIAGFVTNVGDGLETLVAAAGPIFDELETELPELGRDLGRSLDLFAASAEGGATALGDLLDIVGFLTAGTSALTSNLAALYQTVRTGDLQPLIDWWNAVKSTQLQSVGKFWGETKTSAEEATQAIRNFNAAMDEMRGKFMTADQATLAVKESWLALNKELREGKRTLDQNTEAGQANARAILDHINKLERERQAQIDVTGNVANANAQYNANIEKLRAAASAAGYNAGELQKLIDKYKQDQTLTLTTVYRNVFKNEGTPNERRSTGSSRYGGNDNFAAGGRVGFTGIKLVGEEGPELVKLNAGDHVYTASQTRRMMGGAPTGASGGWSGGTPSAAVPSLPPDAILRQALMALIMEMANKGQLQFPARAIV